ncbi:hypothetical protein [Rhodococcus sp. OAS809]|uniref:hypothetical protein n=1 Tax=Rhodococcus sp. OAS809 TaxID=2663874 RepID=UPI0033945931
MRANPSLVRLTWGTLGYPKSAEILDADGIGKQSEFFGGTIRWTPSTGAYVV